VALPCDREVRLIEHVEDLGDAINRQAAVQWNLCWTRISVRFCAGWM
jgi:hypothetical protein